MGNKSLILAQEDHIVADVTVSAAGVILIILHLGERKSVFVRLSYGGVKCFLEIQAVSFCSSKDNIDENATMIVVIRYDLHYSCSLPNSTPNECVYLYNR